MTTASTPDQTRPKRKRGRPRSQAGTTGDETVRALDRGLSLLNILTERGAMTLSDLSAAAGMPASTAHRMLITLQKHRFTGFDPESQEWGIGIGAYRTGAAYLARSELLDVARPVLRRLMEQTGETANLAMLEGHEIVFVSQIETRNPVRAFFRPGTRSLLHASGIGKALLAHIPDQEIISIIRKEGLPRYTANTLARPEALMRDLARIRRQGYALDDEEQFEGMRCVGAAIFNAFGEAVAGISVSGPAARFSPEMIARHKEHVTSAAEEITTATGGRGPAPTD